MGKITSKNLNSFGQSQINNFVIRNKIAQICREISNIMHIIVIKKIIYKLKSTSESIVVDVQ